MFGAIGRFFRAIIYTFVGRLDKWSEVWGSNPAAIKAQYDDIQKEHRARIQSVKQAVAGLLSVQKQKEERADKLSEEINKYGKLMLAAQTKGKQRVIELQGEGKGPEQVQADPAYIKCGAAYRDFASTLKAKQEEAEQIGQYVDESETQLAEYEAELQSMHRELKTIETEKQETIVDVEVSKQKKEAHDLMAGISASKTGESRKRLQDMRRRLKSEAEISKRLTGSEADKTEEEFLEFAISSEAGNEFDQLMGLAAPEEVPKLTAESTKIPEFNVEATESEKEKA